MFPSSTILVFLGWCHFSEALLNCGTCAHGHSLVCPNYFNRQFELQLLTQDGELGVFLQLECDEVPSLNFSLLEGCSFPSAKFVQFRFCPLFNETFRDTFKKIGVHPSNVGHLNIYYPSSGVSALRSDHLLALTNLTYLNFEMAKLVEFPEEAFQYSPNLETLHIRGNDLKTLPRNIFQKLSRLKTLNLSHNNLSSLPEGLLDGLTSLEFVYFWANKLQSVPENLFSKTLALKNVSFLSNEISTLDENLFKNNKQLRNVNFNRNKLSQLPEKLFFNNAMLDIISFSSNRLGNISETFFQSNGLLTSIELEGNALKRLPNSLLKSAVSLNTLRISNNQLISLPDSFFLQNKKLTSLNVASNSISSLPADLFKFTPNLKVLKLGNNRMSSLAEYQFTNCFSLEELDLSRNNLTELSFNSFPFAQSPLRKVDLSRNRLNSTGISLSYVFALNAQINLEKIDFSYNNFTDFPEDIDLYNFLRLRELNFEGNQIRRVRLSTLFELANDSLVNLRNNSIETILNFKGLEAKTINLYVGGNNFTCDCLSYDFIEKIQRGKNNDNNRLAYEVFPAPNIPLNPPSGLVTGALNVLDKDEVACQRPDHLWNQSLTTVQMTKLECDMRAADCCELCPCVYRPFDNMVTVKCSQKNLSSIPDIFFQPNFYYTLDLSKNLISSFNLSQEKLIVNLTLYDNQLSLEYLQNGNLLPPNLTFLDVRKNNLTQVPQEFLSELSTTGGSIDLRENPWTCDCEIKTLHDFIQAQYSKVFRLREIVCVDLGTPLVDLTEDEICPLFQKPIVLSAIGVFTLVLVLLAVMGTIAFYKYKTSIKVWMYSHQLCLWLVTEDELDVDKRYDAFISYSHKDEEFINSILVPGLENGEPKFRVCLHYRDWIVGEFIQNQIIDSVQNSRRTLVVLSTNFIESVWGQMEFRAAHQQALQDKTNRVIVIIYGEMPPEESMDEELRHYISLHTYLKWGHPKFWENLRFAMPHPKHLTRKRHRRKKTDKLEMANGYIKQMVHL